MARKIKVTHSRQLLQDYFVDRKPLEGVQKNFGKGKSKAAEWRRWLRERVVGPVDREPVSRQTLRAQLRRKAYARAWIAGDHHCFPENLQPLPRRERRALARALAAREYKEMKKSGQKF